MSKPTSVVTIVKQYFHEKCSTVFPIKFVERKSRSYVGPVKIEPKCKVTMMIKIFIRV